MTLTVTVRFSGTSRRVGEVAVSFDYQCEGTGMPVTDRKRRFQNS